LIAAWRNVAILVWRRETTQAGVDALHTEYDKLTQKYPGGVFLLTIVEQGAPPPSSEIRKALAKFLARGAGRTILSAVVHEGTGFRAAFVRSVVTGLAVMTDLPYAHKVFATVEHASGWFRTNSPAARAWRERELVEAANEVRERALGEAR
jgi:hypothetical protein